MEKYIIVLFDRLNAWIMESIALKLFIIGVLILLLLIPTEMVTDLIWERQSTSESVVADVSSNWSNAQTIKGPVLVMPYTHRTTTELETRKETRYAVFLPKELHISGSLEPRERKRGIYKVIVYSSELEISGTFDRLDLSGWSINHDDFLFQEAYLVTGISDLRGIKENVLLHWENKELEFDAGFDNIAATGPGIRSPVTVEEGETEYSYRFTLKLNGSQTIDFVPVGKETKVNLRSEWTDPSFLGSYLPENHKIDENGFSANWKVLNFNRSYPQRWLSQEQYSMERSAFGVNLLLPVDHYQKSYRSAKYAVLIISLTFLMFFFIEIWSKKKIHPFHYIMAGIALCVFYTLLLSFSEHIGFGWSYLLSAIAIVSLISYYFKGIMKNNKHFVWVPVILSLLYLYLFIILQLQDYALLAGSVGLFAALGIVMALSRKINWYEPKAVVD